MGGDSLGEAKGRLLDVETFCILASGSGYTDIAAVKWCMVNDCALCLERNVRSLEKTL